MPDFTQNDQAWDDLSYAMKTVQLHWNGIDSRITVEPVQRETKTKIIVKGMAFRKKNGTHLGDLRNALIYQPYITNY